VGFVRPHQFLNEWLRAIAVGIFIGSGFASVSAAATWTALGPFRLAVRLPCALVWVLMTGLLVMFNIITSSDGGSHAAMESLVLALAYLSLWVVVQTPLWIVRSIYRFRLDLPMELNAPGALSEHQFGIRQLLIVTAVVAAALGAGRLLVLGIGAGASAQRVVSPDWEFLVIIGLFLVSNSLVAFIVVTGALLPRRWRLAVTIGVALVVAISLAESATLMLLPGGTPGFWYMLLFIGTMNAIQFGWLLASLLLLRAAGYRLVAAR
jgi:hypothetical protein